MIKSSIWEYNKNLFVKWNEADGAFLFQELFQIKLNHKIFYS